MDNILNTNINTSNLSGNYKLFISNIIITIITIIFIVFIFILLFNTDKSTGNLFNTEKLQQSESITINTIIVVTFFITLFGLIMFLLPGIDDFKNFFFQIKNVFIVILYTIFVIIFFRVNPNNYINNYSNIILPITFLIGVITFIYGFKQDKIALLYNINHERIKSMILLFCLITLFITYYYIDPSGYMKKYFGPSVIITLLITVFLFIYFVLLLSLPEISSTSDSYNMLNSYTFYSLLGYILFLIITVIGIMNYPGGFFSDKTKSIYLIIAILFISILWGSNVLFNFFSNTKTTLSNVKSIETNFDFIKRSLIILFGLIVSSLFIGWLVLNLQNISSKSGILTFILNLSLIITVLAIIIKTININFPKGNSRKNGFFSLIFNTLFYIPCLFTDLFDYLMKLSIREYNSSTTGIIVLIIILLLIISSYFTLPIIESKVNMSGGKKIQSQNISLNNSTVVASHFDLNNNEVNPYKYGISLWVYLDALPPNTNSSYNKYTSIINYDNRPNILYNPSINELIVSFNKDDQFENDNNTNNIIYKTNNFNLQKWNNIIINYDSGTLDIFINKELVKSEINIVPYMKLSNITIGEQDGLIGHVRDIIYFNEPLKLNKINYIYEKYKDK